MLLDTKAYDFAHRILNIYYEPDAVPAVKKIPDSIELEEPEKDAKRIIGKTDYKKYDDLAKRMELEEKVKEQKEQESRDQKKDALKMGCNNDLRKERQLMDKPVKDKLEASLIFKREGDDYLKQKNYEEAINSYEKGLLQLFYTFSDDPKEEEESDRIKASINMNCSFCLINQNKYDDALGYLNEALRIDKNNMKALYRTAYCYYQLEKYDDSKEYIKRGLDIEKDNILFINLYKDIERKEKENEEAQNNLYKKLIKS